MLKSSMKSTTSLVLSFAMAASPLAAQDLSLDLNDLELCAGLTDPETNEAVGNNEDAAFPCVDAEGEVILDQAALDTAMETEAEMQAQAEAGEMVEPAPLDVEPMPAETAEADVTAEPAPADVAEAEAEPAPETLPADVAEAGDEVEILPDLSGEASDMADAEAEADIETETVVEAPSVDEPLVEEAPENLQAQIEADLEAEAEATANAEDTPEAEGMPAGGDDAAEIADLPTVDDEPAGDDIAFEQVEQTSEDEEVVISEDAPVAAAAASESDADIAAEMDAADADVETEELTAADVRSSSQDFETTATGEARAEARSDDDDRDNSNFEKALLLGLGAVVVGSILNNGDEVVSNSGDRVVVERDGELVVLKDDDVLLRQPGAQVQTQTFDDGSTRTVVTREDGTKIVTIRSNDGRVLRRARILEDGTQVTLFDDTAQSEAVVVSDLPRQQEVETRASQADVNALRVALQAERNSRLDRTFSLRQVRQIRQVRELAPEVQLDTVTFATGSAAIDPSQAEELTNLGLAIADIIEDEPGQVFLIEGHTDAVGDAGYNLALSDRRAETVALALTEYFGVPPENLITQGYGESVLKVQTLAAERENRRAAIRNITTLLN